VTYHFFPFALFSGLASLLLLAGLVLLIIWVVRALAGPNGWRANPPAPHPPAETPLDILARRFASGEITAEEYTRSRDLLREPPKP
jgi:uncharacterized membrane protein